MAVAHQIKLEKIFVTQDNLRNYESLPTMVEFIRQGGVFSPSHINSHLAKTEGRASARLIHLVQMNDDGGIYADDGHHRLVAMALGGRDYVDPAEYVIRTSSYREYMNPEFDNDWSGGFDPRHEVRKFEFYEFKHKVLDCYRNNGLVDAFKYIYSNRDAYVRQRPYGSVVEMLRDMVRSELIG